MILNSGTDFTSLLISFGDIPAFELSVWALFRSKAWRLSCARCVVSNANRRKAFLAVVRTVPKVVRERYLSAQDSQAGLPALVRPLS